MNTPNVDGRDKHEVLAEILDNHPWWGPTYFLSLAVYYLMFTLIAFPLVLQADLPSKLLGLETKLETMLFAIALDIAAFFPRRKVFDNNIWLQRSFIPGQIVGNPLGSYIKIVFIMLYAVGVLALIALCAIYNEDLVRGRFNDMFSENVFYIVTLSWIGLISFFPPAAPLNNCKRFQFDRKDFLFFSPIVQPIIRFPFFLTLLGLTIVALAASSFVGIWSDSESLHNVICIHFATLVAITGVASFPVLMRLHDIRLSLNRYNMMEDFSLVI